MWNYKVSNIPCNLTTRLRLHQVQLERLLQVKGEIDNKAPYTPKFLRLKSAKSEKEKERIRKINYENKIIYSRMYEVLNKSSPYNKEISKPVYCPALDKSTFNYTERMKKKELIKRNKWLKQRFMSSKSYYPFRELKKSSSFNDYLVRNISKQNSNPNINYAPFKVFQNRLNKKISTISRCNSTIGFHKTFSTINTNITTRRFYRSQSASFIGKRSK